MSSAKKRPMNRDRRVKAYTPVWGIRDHAQVLGRDYPVSMECEAMQCKPICIFLQRAWGSLPAEGAVGDDGGLLVEGRPLAARDPVELGVDIPAHGDPLGVGAVGDIVQADLHVFAIEAAHDGLIVLRTPKGAEPPEGLGGLDVYRTKKYGSMLVTLLEIPRGEQPAEEILSEEIPPEE
mgnify:CR=1 FL=1